MTDPSPGPGSPPEHEAFEEEMEHDSLDEHDEGEFPEEDDADA